MTLKEIDKYIYIKTPLNKVFFNPEDVPDEFLLEWYKDSYDYIRIHTDKELKEFMKLNAEQIMEWLEEAAAFTWELKKSQASQR